MTRSPQGWQSDALGRPRGLTKIHVVDASVLPEIPSGPVTLTIMANAHRIAAETAALDNG
jgi:choline dehydrogenase-like flavoprotein